MLRLNVFLPLLVCLSTLNAREQQPKVDTIEQFPARRSTGIVALPDGSPWCNGLPTAFFPGHKNFLEDRPSCLVNGEWSQDLKLGAAVLDVQADELNALDGDTTVIDRHNCGVLDINNDGIMDMYCMVGANVGLGTGYNEVYLTQPDGSLEKVLRHALQRFNGMRTRKTTILKDANGVEMVFISANFRARLDGKVNRHSMFRKNGHFTENWRTRFFDYVPGPWHRNSRITCAMTIDANGDGLDDLLICNENDPAWLFLQNSQGGFTEIFWRDLPRQANFRNARVSDLTGDGIPDLAVIYAGTEDSGLRVFRGTQQPPYYDFANPYYNRKLDFAAPDLELFDANGDGIDDIYIVQTDERLRDADGSPRGEETYCAGRFNTTTWWPTNPISFQTPPPRYTPPPDTAADVLLVSTPDAGETMYSRYRIVEMNHRLPGCGCFVKKFTNRSLLLAQGGFDRPGQQFFLDWN